MHILNSPKSSSQRNNQLQTRPNEKVRHLSKYEVALSFMWQSARASDAVPDGNTDCM